MLQSAASGPVLRRRTASAAAAVAGRVASAPAAARVAEPPAHGASCGCARCAGAPPILLPPTVCRHPPSAPASFMPAAARVAEPPVHATGCGCARCIGSTPPILQPPTVCRHPIHLGASSARRWFSAAPGAPEDAEADADQDVLDEAEGDWDGEDGGEAVFTEGCAAPPSPPG
eukprot:COSAG05_NODE_292_length_12012_cov_12.968354_13_plen_173_part_00